jgi:predicted DCC family thiol-disulfide oxidoreductase YuxK
VVARLLPRPLRDTVYDWVAANRYRWFGQRASCRIPTPQERERFLLD